MKAKRRTLIFLLACVLAASAALVWLDRRSAAEEDAASAAEEGSIPLSSFGAADLSEITYTYSGETLTLEYSGGAWTLQGDEAYHLDTTACNTMVTALSALNAKRQLTEEAGEDYGFSSPLVTVTVTAGGATNTFTFGAENSVTGDIYVRKAGDEALYTVASAKVSCFELTKEDLFGAFNPAGLTASDIEAVRYTCGENSTISLQAVSELAQGAESEASSESAASSGTEYETVWRLADDAGVELDQTKVNSILSALSSYVSAQFTNADFADYGLTEPQITAEVTAAGSTVKLAYYSGTDGCYLVIDGDSSLYQVDGTTLQAFPTSVQELAAGE